MILKPPSTSPPTDPRQRAGVEAEHQMAHDPHRAFATSAEPFALRLVNTEPTARD